MSVGLTVLPIVVAAVRAAAGDWMPIGDDAYFTARSLDVGTANHPLLGAWSSGSVRVETSVNNLGPLQFDLLAPFTRIAPVGGTAIGVAAVHVAAVLTIAWTVRRMARWSHVVASMAAVSVMLWNLGSENLITPQQHQFLTVAYLALLFAAWAAAAGDRWSVVPAVFFASLVAQTHLSYPVLVAALAVPIGVGLVGARRRDDDPEGRVGRAPFVVAGVLVAVLWAQTIVDQFAGRGNLLAVFGAGDDASGPSVTDAGRLVAAVLASPRGYLRPGYGGYGDIVPLAATWRFAALVLAWVAGAGAAVAVRRAGHRRAAAGLSVALTAVAAAFVDAVLLPYGVFGLYAPNYRWLWPTAAFVVAGAMCGLLGLAGRRGPTSRSVATGVTGAILVVASIANLATSTERTRPDLYREEIARGPELLDQVGRVEMEGPVLVDIPTVGFGSPYTYVVLASLTERGIDYHFDDERMIRRFGDGRRADGGEPYRLVIYDGVDATARRNGADTIAYVAGPTPTAIELTANHAD